MNSNVHTRTTGSQSFAKRHVQQEAGKARPRNAWCSLSWLPWRRPEPTTYEKCLAVHMYFAASPTTRQY